MHLCLSLFCVILQVLLCPAGAADNGVIGGKKAQAHSRPYMVSLQVRGSHVCGGFLIRKDFVLTAAHCKTYVENCEEITVVLGANNISPKEKAQRIPAEKCSEHPGNVLDKYDYDIMLIKLKHNAIINKTVKTIELPKKGENLPENTDCLFSGWGMTRPSGSAANNLMEVLLKTQNSKDCMKIWYGRFFPSRMLCTHSDGTKGFCAGDSGGPLVFKKKAYGIAVFTGIPCTEKKPDVYMKVSFFIPWITKTMNQM